MIKVGSFNESTRVAWLKETLKKIPAGARILDAGAGEQQFKPFCSHLKYVAQDFAQYEGTGDGKGLQMGKWDQSKLDIVSDITHIPEPDRSFDAVMCTEVFEHLPDPISAIQEFARLLKTGGTLVITAPFCSITHFAPYHFYSGFNIYFYQKHLLANGFEIVDAQRNGNYFEYIAQEIRRVKSTAQQYANDRPNFFELGMMYFILRMLGRFSKKDKNSNELLCYGYHILARKIK